jgi:hypothetical protein
MLELGTTHASVMRFWFLIPLLWALLGCGKPVNPGDQPMSFWADPNNGFDSDPCTHATAQAIIKSGLPYPNITTYEVTGAGGKVEKRIKTVDVWIGSTRFVLPGKVMRDNGMYARNHPMRFWGLQGSLPNFYPVGDPGPVIDGMGSMVDVRIICSVDPDYVASWGKGYRSNEEGIAKVKARYEQDMRRIEPPRQPSVTVNPRDDIGMMEVLFDRGGVYNDGQPMWEASYWPLKGELKSPDGGVSGIGCTTRHDPQKRYGGVGWRCTSSVGLTPQATATIEIYVSQIQHMPAIYEQVKQVFLNAKQP